MARALEARAMMPMLMLRLDDYFQDHVHATSDECTMHMPGASSRPKSNGKSESIS